MIFINYKDKINIYLIWKEDKFICYHKYNSEDKNKGNKNLKKLC